MTLETITREEFDRRLEQSTERMRLERLALEAQVAELKEQVQQATRTQDKEVAAFLLDSIRKGLRHDALPESDMRLLQIINAPIAPQERQERDALLTLQKQRELTEAEQETLTRLIDVVELANAKRWQCLAELAQRRGLSLAEITQELEIPFS